MLRSSGFGIALFINIIMICLWHFLSYIISRHIGSRRVDYRRFPYRTRDIERNGEFYVEYFAIDSWYRLLPSRLNQTAITPRRLRRQDALTVKEYLQKTCRCELCSILNCFYIVWASVMDAPYMAFILGMIVILINLPFIAASRYCRCLIHNELELKRKELEEQGRLAEQTPNVFELDIF